MSSAISVRTRKKPNNNNRNNRNNKSAKQQKRTGLTIGDTAIQRISGPISITIVRPNEDVYKKGLASFFPIIVMFGDLHRSMENMCESCITPDCYTIFDPAFLKHLDGLADAMHPIDFYTETTIYGTQNNGFSSPLQPFVSGDMVFCYQKYLRNTNIYKKRCPTENIRWHASDVRFWGDAPYIGSYAQSFAENTYLPLNFYAGLAPKKLVLEYLQPITSIIISAYGNSNATSLLKERIDQHIASTMWGSTNAFLKVFKKLEISPEQFAHVFFAKMTKDNSLIYKQIEKQSIDTFKNIHFWENIYADSIRYYLEYFSGDYQATIKKFIDIVLGKAQSQPQDIIDLQQFLDAINFPLLDIYTLTRLFKQPDNGIRSSLSFGYFGDKHSENCIRILMKMGYYKVIYHKTNIIPHGNIRKTSRCQIITSDIHLSDMVAYHNQMRDLS